MQDLPPEEKKRLAYIEGREDLFRTKVLEIEKGAGDNFTGKIKNVLVEARDPGGANALAPVLELLNREGGTNIKMITDGRAQEIIQGKFKTKDITPQDNILKAVGVVGSPDAVLIGVSDEAGIEMFVSANFPEVPSVLVEDYYGSSLDYLSRLEESRQPFPKKICVMDEVARDIIIKKFPELSDAIEITGQPAFDRFTKEDTKKVAEETKKELGIKPKEKIVTFMSAMEDMALIKRFAEELAKIKGCRFIFRKHPRDNVTMEDYRMAFESRGIDFVNTMYMPTDKIAAASDLVIVTTSTEGLSAIYRRKPSINIIDPEYSDRGAPPSVKLGASVGLDRMENLAICVEELLDPKSKRSKDLQKGMKKHYSADGKNAEKVVKVLNSVV